MLQNQTKAYVAESDEGVFKAGTSYENFHHQAKYPLSDATLVVGFLLCYG